MPAYADPTPKPISADTIFLAFELSGTSWLVALHAPDADKVERHRLPAGVAAEVLGLIARTKARVTRRLGRRHASRAATRPAATGSGCTACSRPRGSRATSWTRPRCRSTAVPGAQRPIGWMRRRCCGP